MTPGWKEVAKALGFVLLFAIIGYNLYVGTGILIAVFRGVVAWLIFQILNILITNIFVRLLSEYEYDRLKKLVEEEEVEEMRLAQLAEEEDELSTEDAPAARPKSRPATPRPQPARPTPQTADVNAEEKTPEPDSGGGEGVSDTAGAGGDG